MKNFFPIFEWLSSYKKSFFKGDIIAGLTVSIVLIPQGIAYAMIAGLPPIYGLYCALVPQFVYAIFGTSRQVAIGPIAMDSLVVATGVSALALRGTQDYISIAISLGLMVGIIQFLLGIFRLGFIVNFLSKPVLSGFASAVALLIGLNQFKNLLGIHFPQSSNFDELILSIIEKLPELDMKTAIIGVVSCLIIYISKKINRKIPNALIVVVLGIFIMFFFGLQLDGVAIVGEIPSGLPSFSVPIFEKSLIKDLFPTAITLVVIGYLELISIGKTLEAKQTEYRIDANKELIALGLSNTIGSFFKSYIATSSFSRSAINQESGAKTGVAAIVSILMVVFTLFFLTPIFAYLPKSILASIIIVAVFGLIQIKEAKRLFKISKIDFLLMISTFVATLFLNIEQGILVGVLFSIAVLIFRMSRPTFVELGTNPNSDFYSSKELCNVVLTDDILIIRFEAQIFYANSSYFREKLEEMISDKGGSIRLIVLDAKSINRIDSTGADMINECISFYKNKGVYFYFVGVKSTVSDLLFRSGLLEGIDASFFRSVNEAVVFFKTGDN